MMTYGKPDPHAGVAAGVDLEAIRHAAAAQVAALTAQHAEVVAAAEGSNADDEHDPEGATLAFERQQVVALLQQAKASLAQAEQALRREADGSYGTCEGCGGSIGAARLEARPSASLCIACASSQSRRR